MVGFSAAGDFLNRGKAEFSNMQNDRSEESVKPVTVPNKNPQTAETDKPGKSEEPAQTTEASRKGRIIPEEEVMKKFKEIYQNHRAVFDYLKEH